ncbi:hypothetical protein Ae201684P_014265 [Aphanomyces euteiches]|nr:hypothetical protein Ae201684P_014265 [Aphanomyces euteiches]
MSSYPDLLRQFQALRRRRIALEAKAREIAALHTLDQDLKRKPVNEWSSTATQAPPAKLPRFHDLSSRFVSASNPSRMAV